MKTKLSLFLWAAASLFLSSWSVGFAMTGVFFDNSEVLTFIIALAASLVSAICGAGFMQQWMIAKKKNNNGKGGGYG
jgi:hypothetical protein